MSDWLPIESAPKDGTRLMISSAREGALVCVGYWVKPEDRGRDYCQDEDWWHVQFAIGGMKPTHWMPLPNPPISGSGGDNRT